MDDVHPSVSGPAAPLRRCPGCRNQIAVTTPRCPVCGKHVATARALSAVRWTVVAAGTVALGWWWHHR